jgi:hypothetical protein
LIENIDLKSNRDISLYDINLKDFAIKPTMQETYAVSIAIACSESPVPLNFEGLAKETSIEESLQRVVDENIKNNLRSSQLSSLISKTPIPNNQTWIVTM